jgi:membrane-bound serine protease (ClpP class)
MGGEEVKTCSKLINIVIFAAVLLAPVLIPFFASASDANSVFIIPVKGEIGPALSEFVIDSIGRAEKSGAHTIIFEIDTLGGRIDNTFEIKDAINSAVSGGIQVISFVDDEALSAGVMITMLGQKVAMVPSGSMGSAEVRPFDEKTNSAWTGELKAITESRGRNGDIVAAMADKDVYLEGIKDKGKLLNVTAKRAKELGLCDIIVNNRQELLHAYNLTDKTIIEAQPNINTKIAGVISGRYIGPLLLILGIAALVIEIFTPSFGIMGTISILSLSTYFAGSILAGRSGWGAVILFTAGLLLLFIEAHIPGFGAAGIGGIVSLSLGIVFSSGDIVEGLILLLMVMTVLIVTVWLLLKYAPRTGIFKKLVLDTKMKSEFGYAAATADNGLIGQEGTTLTILRPSGKADICGNRIDVTTEGDFIKKGSSIKVVKIEGNKITVKEV